MKAPITHRKGMCALNVFILDESLRIRLHSVLNANSLSQIVLNLR